MSSRYIGLREGVGVASFVVARGDTYSEYTARAAELLSREDEPREQITLYLNLSLNLGEAELRDLLRHDPVLSAVFKLGVQEGQRREGDRSVFDQPVDPNARIQPLYARLHPAGCSDSQFCPHLVDAAGEHVHWPPAWQALGSRDRPAYLCSCGRTIVLDRATGRFEKLIPS